MPSKTEFGELPRKEKMFSDFAFKKARTTLIAGTIIAMGLLSPAIAVRGVGLSRLDLPNVILRIPPVIVALGTLAAASREISKARRIRKEVSRTNLAAMRDKVSEDAYLLSKRLKRRNPGYSQAKILLKDLGVALWLGMTMEEARKQISTKMPFRELDYIAAYTPRDVGVNVVVVPIGFLRLRYKDPRHPDESNTREIVVDVEFWCLPA